MAIIENDIQYNWVRKRLSKLKEKVDENTSSNNSYRIELELLSKLEKEYSEEFPCVPKPVIEDFERTQISVYEGMEMVKDMVRMKCFAQATGKQQSIWSQKQNRCINNGGRAEFEEKDLLLLNGALQQIGNQLTEIQLEYSDNREAVVEEVRKLDGILVMRYLYETVLGKTDSWYKNRMRRTPCNGKVYYFTKDDILRMNLAILDISNRLKSIELIL